MSNAIIYILLAVIVLVGIITYRAVAIKKPAAKAGSSTKAKDKHSTLQITSENIRRKKTKCQRCGGLAFSLFGTKNIYRCRSCGFRTKVPGFESHDR